MVTPTLAIVGRPNVGKSTLFNRLIGKKKAIVDDKPGITIDRLYGELQWRKSKYTLIDTAGLSTLYESSPSETIINQVMFAIDEAHLILLITDAKAGLQEEDKLIANLLRKSGKPFLVVVNKVDNTVKVSEAVTEFYSLGTDRIYPISALHGTGIDELLDDVIELLPPSPDYSSKVGSLEEEAIKVAIVGRPNVGKSTMLNKILGTNRVHVSPEPGTTRDPVDVYLERDGHLFCFIDTAGVRKRGRIKDSLEKVFVGKALESIRRCDIVILLIDAQEGATDQDLHLGGYVKRLNKGCIIGINKWDTLVGKSQQEIKNLLNSIKERFKFLPYAPVIPFSAMTGKNIPRFFSAIKDIHQQYTTRIGTGVLNRALAKILEKHHPPAISGKILKFYYITQPSVAPPTFVIFCNRPEDIHFSYERYFTNQIRSTFNLTHTPIRIIFRKRGETLKPTPE
ncbi:MAG: ribosome biogenesis GTPase Der [Syntrophobacterales bacterium]|nr:ribosome biogenesis GTPase Der [Syntrophobacterales bacterium]